MFYYALGGFVLLAILFIEIKQVLLRRNIIAQTLRYGFLDESIELDKDCCSYAVVRNGVKCQCKRKGMVLIRQWPFCKQHARTIWLIASR